MLFAAGPGRKAMRRVVAVGVVLGLCGCGSSTHVAAPSTTVPATTTTTLPEALWLGQAKVWFGAHGTDLKGVSAWAKRLGEAAKIGNARLAQIAVQGMLIDVGRADGDLPANAFGQDLHQIFVEYVTALNEIRTGILKNDQRSFKTGSDALAVAVAHFGVLANRLKASP